MKMKKRIESTRGASIILALYFLLICTVLSSLIILSGSVASGSSIKTEEYLQEENISLSVFKMFSTEISSKTFEYDNTEGCAYFEQRLRALGVNLLNGYIAEGFEYIDEGEEYQRDFEVKIDKLGTNIAGTFSINKNYEIEISINQSSIKFYPLNKRNDGEKLIVKMGEGEIL